MVSRQLEIATSCRRGICGSVLRTRIGCHAPRATLRRQWFGRLALAQPKKSCVAVRAAIGNTARALSGIARDASELCEQDDDQPWVDATPL